jgi:hypothetical protein
MTNNQSRTDRSAIVELTADSAQQLLGALVTETSPSVQERSAIAKVRRAMPRVLAWSDLPFRQDSDSSCESLRQALDDRLDRRKSAAKGLVNRRVGQETMD